MEELKADQTVMSPKLRRWLDVIARYVRAKRGESRKVQKEFAVSRRTISDLENGVRDFTLGTLLDVLDAVGGDVSEVFESRIPKQFSNPHHQLSHELLQDILEKASPEAINWIVGNIQTFHAAYVRSARK